MTIFSVPISQIVTSKDNPRQTFDEDSLQSLAESIATHGLLQPIIVRPKDGVYELVVGERRLRAVKLLGQKSVLAKVEDFDDATCFELRLIENTHREDLTDAEKGDAVYGLMEAYPEKYPSIASVAEAINKPYGTVQRWTKKTRKLSDYVKLLVIDDQNFTDTHSLLLLKYPHTVQDKLAKQIIDKTMTYNQARHFCRLYDENPQADLNDLATKAKGEPNRVTIDTSKLTPKAREEVNKILKEKEEEIEETRKESLKKAQKAPRRPRPNKPRKRNNKKKEPPKPKPNIFDEAPTEGIVFTLTIQSELFRQVTDLAQELGSLSINETFEQIITKFFEWRSQHEL